MGTSNKFVQNVLERLAPLAEKGDALPLHEPTFGKTELSYVRRCIESGWVSSSGAFVEEFERRLTELTGAEAVIAVVNGTAALHLSLVLCGVKPGDEVLIPSLTFVATANAVHYCGAIPHFVDCEPIGLGLDVEGLRRHLTEIVVRRGQTCINRETGRTLRALVPMHTFGHPVQLDAVVQLAEEFGFALVEDAAEALGSYYKGTHVGRFGRVSSLSFNGNKIVTTGGGGAVITDDVELASLARHLSTTAKLPHRWEYIHDHVGYNYRMPNLNAALGCGQLERLPSFLAQKRRLATWYRDRFRDLDGTVFLEEPPGCKSNYWLNTLVLAPDYAVLRGALLEAAHDARVFLRPNWEPLHRLIMYRSCPRMEMRNCRDFANRLINLPSSPCLADRLDPSRQSVAETNGQ